MLGFEGGYEIFNLLQREDRLEKVGQAIGKGFATFILPLLRLFFLSSLVLDPTTIVNLDDSITG